MDLAAGVLAGTRRSGYWNSASALRNVSETPHARGKPTAVHDSTNAITWPPLRGAGTPEADRPADVDVEFIGIKSFRSGKRELGDQATAGLSSVRVLGSMCFSETAFTARFAKKATTNKPAMMYIVTL